MEVQNTADAKEEFVYVSDKRLIGLLPMFILVLIIVLRISWTLYKSFGQKTRSPQQRRMYVGSRARPSLGQPEPTIYVSPSNLPPPPKYECMAPPSYEEVVGVHYPQFQAQPITQPITSALAQSSSDTTTVTTISETRSNDNATRSDDAITVPRTVPVATSSS
ncbi:uncharacterized protein LOC135118625 isoform X4 [Helicoverpa armigera]|uniref:uncharacterized protein LOC135118625 isoform X4 n=1 Tax=Helicoverpa armigera TaxID=29058 RepID=UPI000B39CF88|nr:uncharacterized protein LOC110379324 isoform X3 [Helicoverpa armigera]